MSTCAIENAPTTRQRHRVRAQAVGWLGAAILLCTAVGASAQATTMACGSLRNSFGPLDYRTERGESLRLVEGAHFPPMVESLVRGHRGYLGGDIDYTLRAYPNHHRALVSVMRYGQKTKSPHPPDMTYSVECYFERALRFQPDDAIVRMIYATFLQKAGRDKEADAQLERATELAQNNAFTHYNIGLVYMDGKNYEGALRQAHRAYALDFSRTELKERLLAAGHWREPAGTADAGSASAASSLSANESPK